MQTFGQILGPLILILQLGALAFVWFFKPARRLVIFGLKLLPAALLTLMGVAALIIWKPVSWVSDRFVHLARLDRLANMILSFGARRGRSRLLRGDRRAFAEGVWRPNAFPDLYTPVPDDLVRPPYEDGRLLGGVGLVWLADRHFTDRAYQSAIRAGFKAGVLVFLVISAILVLNIFLNVLGFIPALFDGQRPVLEEWPNQEPVRVSFLQLFQANIGAESLNLANKLTTFVLYEAAAVPIAIGAGVIMMFLLLTGWMRAKSEPYRLVSKDADVRWPYRIESRALLRQTYRRQITHLTGHLKNAATYLVGQATGTLRVRGDLAAPVAGQTVKLDRESLFQHVLVFGGTGEGKTTAMLKPLLRQVLADRSFGAFVADAKGVLWRDALKVAQAAGRQNDVIVIGAGPDQKGLNPIASLTPTQVAATLRSVLRQMSGGAADNFWPEMAANVIRHTLTIGQAYGRIEAGKTEAAATGVNPYSLWWAYRAIILPDNPDRPAPLRQAVEKLRAHHAGQLKAWAAADAKDDDAGAEAITREMEAVHNTELSASIDYLEGAWAGMANETRTGIIASVTQLLDGFSGAPVLRERFASGHEDGMADIRQALDGKLVLNALSSIEDGLPARLVSILIKTALYREARVREAQWKTQDRSPQDHPCLVMMDEVQELATVDPASGLSDDSFWNVARSTGLAGVFATQTLAALSQSMGKEAADNFIQQARSRIFFRTEEQATVEYACWCAGQYERNRVYDDGHRESIEYRGLIDGWDPLAPVDDGEEIIAGPRAFFDAALGLLFPHRLAMTQAQAAPTYDVDLRFIASDPTPGLGGGGAGNAAAMSSRQSAHWRAEDLTRQYRMQGNEREQALTPADMIHMGRWHAFAQIQRAGAVRQDIVRVEHDHS